MLIIFQPVHHLRARLRKVTNESEMIAKADQKHPVFRPKDVVEKDFQVVLVLLRKLILAAAEIDYQPERERNIDTVGKEGNLLRDRIFKDFNIVFSETVHQRAARITR